MPDIIKRVTVGTLDNQLNKDMEGYGFEFEGRTGAIDDESWIGGDTLVRVAHFYHLNNIACGGATPDLLAYFNLHCSKANAGKPLPSILRVQATFADGTVIDTDEEAWSLNIFEDSAGDTGYIIEVRRNHRADGVDRVCTVSGSLGDFTVTVTH